MSIPPWLLRNTHIQSGATIGGHASRTLQIPEDKFHRVDLTDLEALESAVQGMDVVVQMAADPRPEASWENLLAALTGTL